MRCTGFIRMLLYNLIFGIIYLLFNFIEFDDYYKFLILFIHELGEFLKSKI